MKKFIKNIGKILSYPVKILFIWKAVWSIIKFVMDKAMKGEPVTLKSTFGASTKNDSITYCKSAVLS